MVAVLEGSSSAKYTFFVAFFSHWIASVTSFLVGISRFVWSSLLAVAMTSSVCLEWSSVDAMWRFSFSQAQAVLVSPLLVMTSLGAGILATCKYSVDPP